MAHPPTDTARRLRRDQTDAEQRLWGSLRDRRLNGWKFRRQQAVGRYFADFMCVDARLIVELDGSQHAESRHDYDARRTEALEALEFRVLRIENNEVYRNLEGVLTAILGACEGRPSP
jgi:very-short-patch-repair endonuclease